MCTINERVFLEKVTVYKVAYKFEGKYYSYFSGYPISVGKVKKPTRWKVDWLLPYSFNTYKKSEALFNEKMVGRVSGFRHRKDVNEFYTERKRFEAGVVLLKMTLGGVILKGDGSYISSNVPDDAITYAGTEIIDFEEV